MQSLSLFMQLPGFTWEEVYWANAISLNQAALVANARAKLLAPPAMVADVRITDTAIPHWAVYLVTGTFNGQGSYVDYALPPGNTFSDRAYSVALAQTVGAGGSISRRYLGGVPDSLVAEVSGGQTPGGLNPAAAPAFQAAYSTFVGVLAANSMGWLKRVYAGGQPANQVVTNGPSIAPVGIVTSVAITPGGPPNPGVLLRGFRSINTRVKNLGGGYFVSSDPTNPPPPAGKFVYYLLGTTASQGNNVLKPGLIYPWQDAIEVFRANPPTGYYSLITKATHRKRGVKELAPAGRSKIRR